MLQRRCLVISVMTVLSVMSSVTFARDTLESIIKKSKLTDNDVIRIEQEVADRAKKLAEAGKKSERRKQAREVLLATVRINKASQAGLTAYAQACDSELGNLVTNSQLTVAFDAVLILVDLDSSETAKALARALLSEHPAVRYRAARGIQMLHKKIAVSQEASAMVLRALGRSGAMEKDEHVLRMIYEAINFHAGVRNFQHANESARALNEVLAGRVNQLKAGSRDEWKDKAGYEAAVDCYSGATPDQRRTLIKHMVRFLNNHLDRFFHEETAKRYLKTLKRHVKDVEKAIHEMMTESKVNPPSNLVGDHLRSKPSSKTERKARDAMAELTDALNKANLLSQSP
ncbi:MAG: hypothetical protein MI923_04280 [Phycisphaerales bacterium]|nr:hypothetical protein [Phycisphaerales bacterium]